MHATTIHGPAQAEIERVPHFVGKGKGLQQLMSQKALLQACAPHPKGCVVWLAPGRVHLAEARHLHLLRQFRECVRTGGHDSGMLEFYIVLPPSLSAMLRTGADA